MNASIGSKARRQRSSSGPVELAGPVYVDASALVKLYFPEPDSDALNQQLQGRRDLVVSDLAITEVVSSLARRRRERALRPEVVQRTHRTLLGHLDEGVFRRTELIPACHRVAERLLLQLREVPLRAADALHLALTASADCATVLTYDTRLAQAAQLMGFGVFPLP